MEQLTRLLPGERKRSGVDHQRSSNDSATRRRVGAAQPYVNRFGQRRQNRVVALAPQASRAVSHDRRLLAAFPVEDRGTGAKITNNINNDRHPHCLVESLKMVRDAGFEPATSCV